MKANRETLKITYNEYVKELNEKFNLKDGLELYTAVLFTALEILEKLYNINTANMLATVLSLAKAYNKEAQEELSLTKEKIEEKIVQFVLDNKQNFIYSEMQREVKAVWGKITEEGIYIRKDILKQLAKYVKLGEKSFKKLLIAFNLAEGGDGKI
ncbi:MAG: hypothetical protein ACP5HH_08395, partial [Fervidicoccaceae archaeon]